MVDQLVWAPLPFARAGRLGIVPSRSNGDAVQLRMLLTQTPRCLTVYKYRSKNCRTVMNGAFRTGHLKLVTSVGRETFCSVFVLYLLA